MRLQARAAALLLTLLGLWPAAAAAGGGTAAPAPPDQGDEGTLQAGQDMALSHTLNGRPLDGALRQKLGHCTGQPPPSARCLDAIRAAGLHARGDLGYLFHDPAQPLRQDLGHGVTLEAPAGALEAPTVFIVGVHPGIDRYPLVNIAPILSLKKAATLTLQPQDVRRYQRWMPDPPDNGTPAGPRTLQLARTGVIIDGQLRESDDTQAVSGLVQRILGQSRSLNPCLHSLTDPETARKISEQARQGISLPQGCRFVPPYVHIAVTEGNQAAPMQTELVFQATPERLQLFRLDTVKGFTVLINGFLWHGDPGTDTGQGGWAMGYARGLDMGSGLGRLTIGDNTWHLRTPERLQQAQQRTDPGTKAPPQASGTGRKRVVRFAADQRQSSWDTRTDPQAHWPDNPVVLSSSTSIVRDGQCAQDALTTRWSAFGTDGKGRSVFISSSSLGQTHVDELCRVFLALGIPNAIRLDGGPSATMTIEGRLLNPLVSLSDLMAFGTARYVIDGVGARPPSARVQTGEGANSAHSR